MCREEQGTRLEKAALLLPQDTSSLAFGQVIFISFHSGAQFPHHRTEKYLNWLSQTISTPSIYIYVCLCIP